MKRFIVLGFMFGAGALLGTACGEDGDDDDGGEAGSGGTSGASGGVTCSPGAGGACQNDQDCPKVESGMARNVAQSCGLGCQQDPDPENCIATMAVSCIVEQTEMSNECATCYVGVVACASEHCLAECGAQPESTPCAMCQIEMGCRDTFDSCSGLTTVPTPVP